MLSFSNYHNRFRHRFHRIFSLESGRPWPRVRLLGFIFVIILGLALQAWTALQGVANFDSDEAVLGLMARHTLQGQLPTYFYGQRYLGTLETLLSAGFMWVLGSNIIAFRISALFLFGVFLILQGVLVYRLWGFRVALLSLLILAFPAQVIRMWTFRPISGFGAVFVLGTGIFLLSLARISQPRLHYFRMAALGVMIGLGFWSHPMIIMYVFTLAIVSWLQMPEWAALREKLSMFCVRVVQIPAPELLPVAMLGVLGLGVLAFFSAGCAPQASFAVVQRLARILLLGAAVGVALLTFVISKRRKQLIAGMSCLAVGFVVGNVPQWRAWLFYGIAPESAVRPSCPTDAVGRMGLLGGELLPAVWGLPRLGRIPEMQRLHIVLSSLAFLVVVAALVSFIWAERKALWSLLALSPLGRRDQRVAIFAILFGLPVTLAALSTNTVDVSSVRYLVVAWQASSVLLAVFLSRLVVKWPPIGLLLVLFWAAYVGVTNFTDSSSGRPAHAHAYSAETVSALTDFLKQRKVQGGYADYWVAYALDFLTQERFTFAPYNVVDRYPLYTKRVDRLSVQAYIFEQNVIPDNISNIDELVHELTAKNARLNVFPVIVEGLKNDVLLERKKVSSLDVWLVSNQQP